MTTGSKRFFKPTRPHLIVLSHCGTSEELHRQRQGSICVQQFVVTETDRMHVCTKQLKA